MALLELEDVRAGYGRVRVLHGVSMQVDLGEMIVVLGPNGAGKTTLLRAISRMLPFDGEVRFDGRPTRREGVERVARRGIGHVPEGRGTFNGMSVMDNLRLGALAGGARARSDDDLAVAFDLFPVLAEMRHRDAAQLSGGQQQMLAIARVLLMRPRLLVLDEPSLGLAPLVVQEIFETLRRLQRDQELGILVVEQNVKAALAVADRVYVIESGEVVIEGSAAELADGEAITNAYLGRRLAGSEV